MPASLSIPLWTLVLQAGVTPVSMSDPPTSFRIDPDASVLAVVTHKDGFASGLAHNHFIVATNYQADFDLRPDDLLWSRLTVSIPVSDLVVDDPEFRDRWYPRLEALEVLSDPFRELSSSDREKIREEMLAEGQLDGSSFPAIRVRVGSVEEKESRRGDIELPYELLVEFTIRGESVFRQVAARVVEEDGGFVVEAVGEFYFSDFGIEPYSAFLGSVKNRNSFHVYLYVSARAEGG